MTADAIVRTRWRSIAVAAVLSLAWSGSALAQTRLYLLTSGDHYDQCSASNCDPGRLIQIDVERAQVTSTPIRHARTRAIGPRVTPDGRFLLWSGSEQADYRSRTQPLLASLFNIAGQQQATPFAASDDAVYAPLTVHPSEMRAYVQLLPGGPVTVAEPANTRTLPLPPCAAPVLQTRSGDGRRLSYFCRNPRSVMVVDSGDGRLLGTVALGAPAYPSVGTVHVLDGAGATLYAADMDNAFDGDPAIYRRFDVATGALLAERQGSEFATSLWAYNQMSGHLYVGNWHGIVALDANTLAEIGRLASPHPALLPKVAFDPEQPHAYIAWPRDDGGPLRVSLVHTGTLATLGSIEIPIDGDLVGMGLGPRPPAVSNLAIVVDQRVATLAWTIEPSRSIATGQVVEAGFSPGATAVRLPVAAGATSLTVPGVPAGRYYVRVRSINGTGLGAPSNEVVVDVP